VSAGSASRLIASAETHAQLIKINTAKRMLTVCWLGQTASAKQVTPVTAL
jgi:hypothetical protein